jgi:hypothetical protein
MPTPIQVMNRYVPGDPVVGAAITFDHDNEDAKTPRTAANGFVTVACEPIPELNMVAPKAFPVRQFPNWVFSQYTSSFARLLLFPAA